MLFYSQLLVIITIIAIKKYNIKMKPLTIEQFDISDSFVREPYMCCGHTTEIMVNIKD